MRKGDSDCITQSLKVTGWSALKKSLVEFLIYIHVEPNTDWSAMLKLVCSITATIPNIYCPPKLYCNWVIPDKQRNVTVITNICAVLFSQIPNVIKYGHHKNNSN